MAKVTLPTEPPRTSMIRRAKDAIEEMPFDDVKEIVVTIFERSKDPVFICDLHGRFLDANNAALNFLGLSHDELIGKNVRDIISRDQLAKAVGSVADVLHGGTSNEDQIFELTSPEGRKSKLSISASLMMKDGAPAAVLAIAKDVTDLTSSEEDLHKARELIAIGEASSRAAHDIKNFLIPMISLLDELSKADLENLTPEAAGRIHALIQPSIEAMARVKNLTKEMVHLSSPGIRNGSQVDVDMVVRNVLLRAQASLARERPELEINMDFAHRLPKIYGDTDQLERAFLNIMVNGIEAMESSGVLGIKTEMTLIDETNFIKVTISDTGHGMSGEVLDKCFTPYFTTKGEKGTGLGLAISLKMIRDHQGEIHVSSEENKGTTFEIFLPVR